jgi:hypothetical protein
VRNLKECKEGVPAIELARSVEEDGFAIVPACLDETELGRLVLHRLSDLLSFPVAAVDSVRGFARSTAGLG